MRVLFSFAGGSGHLQPLIPIAREAQRAGHTVAVAGQAGMISVIEDAGFTAMLTAGETLIAAPKRLPLLAVDAEREDRDLREGFATRLAYQHAGEIFSLCDRWRPDLLVCDEVDFGAVIAAERAGIPYATVLVIASGSFIRKELVAEPINRIRAENGLPVDPELKMLSRYLVLSPFPPKFRHPDFPLPSTAHSFHLEQADRQAPLPPEFLPGNGLPNVYFTLGTIFNLESGDLFERVFAALRDLPVNVIATIGREIDPAEFGPQPANLKIEAYIPQERVLPHCDLMISHGGSGSVMGALSYGVPMVLLPMGADQPHNASRCEALGVARVLDVVAATPAAIRTAVEEVLADPHYQKNTHTLQKEIADLPGLELALRLLERLAFERRPLLAN